MNPYWSFMEPLDARAAAEWGDDWRTSSAARRWTSCSWSRRSAASPVRRYLPGNVQLLGYSNARRVR